MEVSLVVTPDDARLLPRQDLKWNVYEAKLAAARRLGKYRFAGELKTHSTGGDPHRYPADVPEPVSPLSEQAIRMAHEAGVVGIPERR